MSHRTSRLTGLLFGISALFAAFLTGCAANAPAETAKEPETSISAPAETEAAAAPSSGTASQIPALEDDFYESVNHELLSQWEIRRISPPWAGLPNSEKITWSGSDRS